MAQRDPQSDDSRKDYLRYAGLGFEILACILLFAGAGYGLDHWLSTEKPWFLLSLSLFGCGMAIYLMIRELGKKN